MIELELLKNDISQYFGFDISQKNRKRIYIYARAVYYYVALDRQKKIIKMKDRDSLQVISSIVNRDHTTILHAQKNFDTYFKYSEIFCQGVEHFNAKPKIVFNKNKDMTEHFQRLYVLQRQKNNILLKNISDTPIDLLKIIKSLPPDRWEDLLNNKLKPFLLMEKSRKTYEDLKA